MFAQSLVERGALDGASGGLGNLMTSVRDLVTDPGVAPWLVVGAIVVVAWLLWSRR